MTGSDEQNIKEAVLVLLKDLLKLKNGEKILFYSDNGSDSYISHLLHENAEEIGAKSEVFELDSSLALPDIAQDLANKIEQGSFDVICELSEQYFYQTSAWKRALQLGARLYSLAGLDVDAFIRCIGKVNHKSMFQFGMTLKEVLSKANSIQIITKKGTNLKLKMTMGLVDKLIAKLTGKPISYSYVARPSGSFSQKVRSTFMGGQLAFHGIPETMEGTAVIDGYLWPPEEIGQIDAPIILKIRNGKVIEINDYLEKSKILDIWLDRKSKDIQHFCIGFNPGAKLSGKLMEAERVFGSISIGIGTYPFHTDGIMKDPSILVNDKVLVRDGSFVHEELAILQKKLNSNTQGNA